MLTPMLIRLLKRIVMFLFQQLPLKEGYVFLESFSGMSYGCNPKYIYSEAIKRYPKLTYIWSINDTSTEIVGDPIMVRRLSVRYLYYLAVSKYIITNTEFALLGRKRASQIYVNTQHGTPLKKMGYDNLTDMKSRKSKNGRWSLLVSPSYYATQIFRTAYGFDGEVVELGYPRNDRFASVDTESIDELKRDLELDESDIVVFYAPTWRELGSVRVPDFDCMIDESKLNIKILVRFHHLDIRCDVLFSSSNIINVSDNRYDVQELCILSEFLITDYSSIMFDFLILQRPIILYTYDLDDYKDIQRGIYLEFSKLPFMQANDEVELREYFLKTVGSIGGPELIAGYNEMLAIFCPYDDGNSSARVLDYLFDR